MSVISILIFLGYVDQRPALQLVNQSMQQKIIASFVRPCQGDQIICGFHLIDQNHLEKKIQGAIYQITLQSASFSQRDDLNRGMYLAQQRTRSQMIKSNFWQALQAPGVHVYYLGHSRFGWGPDFDPPILTESKGVHRAFYLSSEQMKSGFRSKTEQVNIRASTLGLFSCDSGDLILESIAPRFPQTRFVGTSKPLLPDEAVKKFLESVASHF